MNGIGPRLGVIAHDLLQFMVRNPATRAIYRLVPKPLRLRMLVKLNEGVARATRFEALPAIPVGPTSPDARTTAPVRAASTGDREGVNVFGHLRGEFGLGESARMYATALIEAGVPVALNDLDHDVPHAFADSTLGGDLRQGAPYATNLFFVSPDYMDRAMAFGPAALRDRKTIGCWFWELEAVPEQWQSAIGSVDGIMVASRFTEEAFRRSTSKPVFRVPLPLRVLEGSGASRRDFGLPDDAFVFLVSFDFNSSIHRKNPFAAIDAFRIAFPRARGDVRLMVKTSNGHRYPDELLRLLAAAAGDPRVMVRDQVLPIAHVRALQGCVDAYVSLHRAEGFGLGLAESMAMGKAVLATAWSGNMDFMTQHNSCLVDYRLVPVGEGEYPHGNGTQWADADVEQAAAWMRRLVDEPGLASRLGCQAAADVEASLAPLSAARAIGDAVRTLANSNKDH